MRGSLVRIAARCLHTGVGPTPGGVARFAQAQIPLAATPAGKVKSKPKSMKTLAAYGFGAGAVIGLAKGFYDEQQKITHAIPNSEEEEGPIILPEVPDVRVSRSVKFATDASGLKLKLFQYQTCPFCCKVRALLDFLGVSYDVVEVNSIMRTQTKWSKNYKKVPILVVQTPQGDIIQLNDSSMIVSALYSYVLGNSSTYNVGTQNNSMLSIAKCYPTLKHVDEAGKQQTEIMNKYFLMMDGTVDGRTKEEIVDERKWRKWADDVYVHMLSPNIYRTFQEALESFRYFDQVGEWEKNFTNFERSVIINLGATAMWILGKRLKKRYHLNDDVRKSLYDESDFWMANIKKKGGLFMGGDSPNLSDLAVYGVLSSIEGCQAFKDLTSHSKAIGIWFYRVKSTLQADDRKVMGMSGK